MIYVFAFLAACIFAVELYANLLRGEGLMSWLHLIVIGSLEMFLIGFLTVSLFRFLRGRRRRS